MNFLQKRLKMKPILFLVVILIDVRFINGQLDMVSGLIDMKKVRKFSGILKKSCCSYQPNECMDHAVRKKRNSFDIYPMDDDDRIERFENCLCNARNQAQKCQLEFKINESRKRIDSTKSNRVVFHWHEELTEFNCRVKQDRTIECQFYKKTAIPSKLRDDVELLVTYHTVERSECSTLCDTISCAYEADEQSDFDFYNDNIQHHFEMCMDSPSIMSTTTTTPISTTSDIPVDKISTTEQTIVPDLQTTTSSTNDQNGSGKVKGGKDKSDVPDISGLVGGIVGGLLVSILIIIAIIFYIFRFKGKRTLSRSSSEPIDRKHSVIQETLSDNIYSVMEEPVYQDPDMLNDNRTIRDNEPIVRSDNMLDPSHVNMAMSNSPSSSRAQLVPTAPSVSPQSTPILPPIYLNQKPPTAPKPTFSIGTPNKPSTIIHNEPNSPTSPSEEYHVYERVIPSEQEDNKYEQLKQYEHLGAAPYYIGATEFNHKVAISKRPTPGYLHEDSIGYTEPKLSSDATYNGNRPEYIELESESGYSLAKGVK